MTINQFYRLNFLILIALMVVSCARNPVTGKREVMLMSEGQEIALGKQSDPAIVAQYGLYEDETLQNFINKKGMEMAAISHRPNLDYEFKILDSPVVNAFAVPGGYVYFTRGILAHFNNEAEFIGVLGHEIGHITARHSAKQYSKQMLLQGLFIGGLIVSEDFRNMADVAGQGLGLLFLKFGRDAESQSDELGVQYSTEIGYDAHKMADFFRTLKKLSDQSGSSIPTFLSTHPDPADRYNKVHQMAETEQKAGNQYAVNRDSYLRMIDGIVYGEDPRQGFVENNNFYHPDLKFQFPVPQLWKTVNSPAQVQMAPEDGKALIVFSIEQASTLSQAKSAVIERNKLNVVESTNVRVNGMEAIAMISDQVPVSSNTQQAKPLRVLTYLIKYNDLIYKFHGLTVQEDFNTYFPKFQTTMSNFDTLKDPDKLNRKPNRIKIVEAKKSGTISSVLSSHGMKGEQINELVILNGMEANDQITKGRLIKILQKGS